MAREPTFGEALKQARKALRWGQLGLAASAKISRSALSGYESGVIPPRHRIDALIALFPEPQKSKLQAIANAHDTASAEKSATQSENQDDDMIFQFMNSRRSRTADLSGEWNAMWLTTAAGVENKNREVVTIKKRFDGSWEFFNNAVSDDNPDGGFLWIARLEFFDNKHILGYYCARKPEVLAKGTLCMELQNNGREIHGVWDGLNFDTMWAQGLVVLCRADERNSDPAQALETFKNSRPKMPY